MTSVHQSGQGVVTPEAVRLDFYAAGVGSRAVAWLIDMIAQLMILLAVSIVTALAAAGSAGMGLPGWVPATLFLLMAFAVVWGYPTLFETLWKGRTPGKAALGLRVVTREGAPVRFRHAAIRAAFLLVDFALTAGAGAVVSALVTRRHQRLGDLVAGTIVLRERTGEVHPRAVRFRVPLGWEHYAATLDPSVLDARGYFAVRAFLMRAARLAPHARSSLAERLASPLAQRLYHQPPAGVTPELFLVCLAARYQEQRQEGSLVTT